MIQIKDVIKPTVLFAAGSVAGMAQATVFTTHVDISATNAGTPIAIGVPLANAQFSFQSFPDGPKQDTYLNAAGTAGVFSETGAAYIPSSANSFGSSVKTQFYGESFSGPYLGLRFDVGANTLYGYATIDSPTHISAISYDAPASLAISASVPEPAIWAEMILGFGLAGSALRRRRQAVSRAIA